MPYVEVEVDLDDFRIDDLIEHVEIGRAHV